MVIALGIIWVLDGLEVTWPGSLGAVLTSHEGLGLSGPQVGARARRESENRSLESRLAGGEGGILPTPNFSSY